MFITKKKDFFILKYVKILFSRSSNAKTKQKKEKGKSG